MSSTKSARSIAGSRRGFTRVAVALVLAAIGLVLPAMRALHAPHEHVHAISASVMDAPCPDGCVDPSHHHHGDDPCVLCGSHAAPSLPALLRLAAPPPEVLAAVGAREDRWSAEPAGSSAPRGPPSSIVA